MKIVVNTRLLLKNKLDGIGWFTYQTLKRITLKNPTVEFIFLFDRPFDNQFIFSKNVTPIVIGPQARHPFLYYIWFHISIKKLLNKIKPDLFLSPDGFLSPGAKCKQLAVIHDINFFHNPRDLKSLTSKYYNHFFPKYAKLATRIATVSQYSKTDISNHYHINPNKIDVVYNGIHEGFKPLTVDRKQEIRNKYSNGVPYFLFVGSKSPRKNLVRLIQAFDDFKKKVNSNIKLLLVGDSIHGATELNKIYEGSVNKQDIILLDRVAQNELEDIMGSAFALTFVPYFEGFGIPVIEAMACEVPIICSNVTSIPEVVEDAAILVNPLNCDDITQAMIELYLNEEKRNQLIEKGKQRKLFFSWDKSAALLWNSITNSL